MDAAEIAKIKDILQTAKKEEKALQEEQNVSLNTLKGDDKGNAPGSTIGSDGQKKERIERPMPTEKAMKANEVGFDIHSLTQPYSPTGMRQKAPYIPKAEALLISPEQQTEIDDLVTTEKALKSEVENITEKAYLDAQNAGKAIAAEQSERSNMGITFGGGSDDFGEIYGLSKDLRAINKEISATNVIEKVFNNLPQQQIEQTVEKRVIGSNGYKELTAQFQNEYEKLIPKGTNISNKDADDILSQLSPEEKEAAEKEIAELTQKLETLQATYLQQVGGLYDGTAKQLQNEIYQSVINQLAKKELPKSSLEYIGKALYDHSLVGTFHNLVTGKTGEDVMVREKAYEMYGPSSIEKAVAGAGSILLDSLPFSVLGYIGSAVSTGARAIATREVARQITRRAAVSGTNRAVKEIAKRVVERNALQQFATASLSSAITLGGYDGLLTAAQETLSPSGENGTINWRNVFHRMGEGALTGTIVGGLSLGTTGAKSAMYRARPDMAYTFAGKVADVGIGLAGFTAENAAFLGVGALASGEDITAEAIGESFATLGVLKGIGILKRIAKGEKLIQQPDFVQRAISDLDFTKEEKAAMNKAGMDVSQIDLIIDAVKDMNSGIVGNFISGYNAVMHSNEVPISAKLKLKYIVTGTVPKIVGPSLGDYQELSGKGGRLKLYDYQGRLVQIREFNDYEAGLDFYNRIRPLLEKNLLVDSSATLRGADSYIALTKAVDVYMTSEDYARSETKYSREELMNEVRIAVGQEQGSLSESASKRVSVIANIAKGLYQDSVSALLNKVAKRHGATIDDIMKAIEVKPDLRTHREKELAYDYFENLMELRNSMSGPIEAEQARQAEQMRPQIEQGKREVEDAERETAFVRESLDEAAKKMATSDGTQIAIVRLVSGEQVAVHKGRIVVKENGTIDSKASEETVVVKRFDAEGNEVRNQVHIDEIVEVVEQSTPEASVQSSMDILEAQAIKKKTLDKTLSENGEQGVEVVLIDGTKGKVVGTDDNGAYIFTFEGKSGKKQTLPVSMYEIEAVNTEQPIATTTEQMAISDAVEKVVEQGLTAEVDIEYDEDFPPLTEADLTPEINPDNVQWDKLSQEEYATVSAMTMGDATTLADSHIYYTNSRGDLAKAKQSVAEQQKKIDKLKSRFGTLSNPTQAQKLRKEIAKAEQEKAKREQVARGIEEQMAKYAYAMKKYGVEVAAENDLLAERTRLEEERNAQLEADKELDRYEQEEATKGKKTIANTEANRKYIEQLYADRLGVSPAQAGPRQAILWDLANGAIKLRWDNVTTDSGAVQRGLQAELGVRGTEERRAYKAVIDNKNGQSVDAYVHDLWQSGEWGREISTEELKDELLGVLQSTPNGSLALKELADMSGMQADLEAQISLGKGDIQRKLEEVDAKIAKNAQQMADFRKRINDTVQKLESGEPIGTTRENAKKEPSSNYINPITMSAEEKMYRGEMLRNARPTIVKENVITATQELTARQAAENWWDSNVPEPVFYGTEVGEVEINKGSVESSLAHRYSQKKLDAITSLVEGFENAVYLGTLPDSRERGVVDHYFAYPISYGGELNYVFCRAMQDANKNRLYVHEVFVADKIKMGDSLQTAASKPHGGISLYRDILANVLSESKDTTTIPENQISEEEIFNTPTLPTNEDIPSMIEQKPTEKPMDTAEQAFVRERMDILADVTGVKPHILSKEEFAKKLSEIKSDIDAVRMSLIPKSTAPETAEQSQRTTIATVVSSADGTKVLKDIDSTIDIYKNRSNRTKTFIGDVGKALGLRKTGNSQYGTFESANGEIVTIRISNHNATVSNFDNVGEDNGVSIVIARQSNNGIINNGKAHLVEYFYSEVELNRADGKPLVEILKSLKQALYSGEYKDTTGLAKREEVNNPRFAIEAYHGSGADFEKFDLSFIGTGEGAQAYGHGVYVTTRKGIAKNYADTIGGTIQQERRYEARTNLLVIRKNIADENQAIEKWEKAIQQMKQTYAELESNTPFFKTRSAIENHKKTLQELQDEIDSTQVLIDSSKARVEELKPLEEAADKEWQAMEAPDKIRKLNTQIELHEANLKSQQISIAAMQQRAKIKQAEYDYYNEQLAELESKYGVNSPEYKEYVFKNDYIESEYKDLVKYIEDTKVSSGYLEKMILDEKAELARAKEIQKPFRNLYTVEVPDNTGDNYLSWDKIVPNDIIDRLDKTIEQQFGEDVVGKANLKYGQLGQQMYLKLANVLSSAKAASEFLHSLGFVGIEYPAQYTTGGRADGAKNYVIFNADDVKIVDHVRYMKTPQGVIYGFTFNGETYIDGSELRPGVLIHEFTELWCEIVAEANPGLWDEGKKLLRETDTYKEVMADSNYKNATEEAQYSETLSRITTAKAEKKMGTISDNKSLISKIRSWLRKFWGEVKSAFSKWSKKELKDLTIDQFTSMPLMDYFNGVDIRKYRNAKGNKEAESKSLVGIHNISLNKLQNALKQDGLANPSAAVIDIAKQNHEGYGEYSLIMPKSLVDATSGRNLGTFTGDAWTPTYPNVIRQLDDKGWQTLRNRIATTVGDKDVLLSDIYNGVHNYLEDNRSSKMEYVFLKEKGIEPELKYKGADGFLGISNLEAISGIKNIISGLEAYKQYKELSYGNKYDFNRWVLAEGNTAENARLRALIRKDPSIKETLKLHNDLSFSKFDKFVNDILTKERNAGKIDSSDTLLAATLYVDKNGLRAEFESWLTSLIEELGAKEVFYAGTDRNGNDIYKPHTLENVSRHMRMQGVQNAYDNSGLSATKATLLDRLTTLSDIRKNKYRLQTTDTYNKVYDKLSDRLFNIISALADKQVISSNRFSNIDYAELRLQDALAKKDPIAYLNMEYGYDIAKDSDLAKEIKSFIGDVRKMPAKYFETKFERPVMFNEFAAVVAPDTMPESVEQQLRDAGLAIYKYNPDVEGDRRKATLAATASEDIRFMIVGEKGAAALDQAEEATTRLDNLAVAREMEDKVATAKAEMQKIDDAFNAELDAFARGESGTLHLGAPGQLLQGCGLNATEIYLTPTVLRVKLDQHELTIDDIRNLPSAINDPLMVYEWGNDAKSLVVITYIPRGEQRITAAIKLNRKGKRVEVNKIASVHGKDIARLASEVQTTRSNFVEDNLKYVNKKLAEQWLGIAPPKGAHSLTVDQQAIANIVDKFEKSKKNAELSRHSLLKSEQTIKLATGWERGADGKWRYEIPDFKLKSDTALVKNVDNQIVTTLGEVIDDEALFTAFPELRKLSVVSLPNQEYGGHYQDDSIMPHIALGNKLFTPSTKRLVELEKEFDKDMTSEQEDALMSEFNAEVERAVAQPEFYTLVTRAAKKVLVHEVQHAIQRIEGFARGGSWEIERPDNDAEMLRLREAVRGARAYIDHFNGGDIAMAIRDGKKYNYLEWRTISPESQQILLEYLGRKRKVDYADFRAYLDNAHKMTLPKQYGMAGYRKFAGEVESKNAEARMDMTPEERRATLLSETEDVAREDQIFLESNLGVAQSVEVSEPVEAPTRKPRKSAAEKLLEKIESLREQLKNKKRSLNDTLLDVYNFLVSKDIAETMGEGVGKAQYRRVIKNSIKAIHNAYVVTDAEEKRKRVSKCLSEIDDSLSQLLTHQRLNEVTEILDKAIYGYTAQGVRTGKRIDEHTREIFDILRNAIGEPVEEERDDSGRRKPVRYRLKNRTEAGDITSSFRLRKIGSNEGIIGKLRSEADKIIASADVLDTATTRDAAQLEYTANLLELYDNALQLNEAIGQVTDEISNIQREINRTNELYKAAATGSEEKKNLYKIQQRLHNDLDAERMNRAALRHRYASMLKTFTTSLEQLDDKGADEFTRAEQEKAEAAIKWRKGIYDSIKNPNAPVLPFDDYDRKGKKQEINWKGLNTRAKSNESAFMATFAEMSRDIDINSIPGQWARDGWYYQFMLAPGGYMERTDWRYKTEKALRDELDAEILKMSGNKKTDDPYYLFAALAQEPSGMTLQRMAVSKNDKGKVVGGYQENIPVTIEIALQMRATLRQPNGFPGYNAWGFSESDMQNIVEYVEDKYPQYCRFEDWIVGELWPKLYDMQDAIYFKRFGTHLPKTALYHPFVRDKRFVGKIAEVGEDEVSLPSSVTGNIVERVKTSAKMDLSAGFFEVVEKHIKETLDWCAYSEITDKFNNIATSKYFESMLAQQGVKRDKLKEVYEIAIGQGKINSTENTTLTKVLNAASRGLVAGNIVFNLNSAAKQLVSGSCALGYTANPKIIPIWAKNFFVPSAIKTGVGKLIQQIKSGKLDPVEVIKWKAFADNWNWAIENIPTLRERWEGRNAGFEVLKSHSFESWDKLSSIITKFGLAPNATIDMFTCANVAKTVYEYEYPRLLERGRSKEEAHREACVKAAIFTNETQQSSIDGFLSSFQSSSGLLRLLGVGLGAYQNTSMAFARNERFAITNMLRMLNPNTKQLMTARQVEAYKEMGMGVEKATELAKEDFKESQGAQFSAFIHNGVVSNLLWTLASTVLTTAISTGISAMFGGKEEWEKVKNNEKFRDELSSALSIETMVWQAPLFYNAPIVKQLMTYSYNAYQGKTYGGIFESPSSQSTQEMIDAVFKQWVGVKNDVTGEREKQEPTRYDRSAEWIVFSTLVKAGLCVNPDLVARMAEGIDDMMKDGVQAEDVMNVLSSPRGLTRAIAGEPRKGESKQQYLDRLSYIYRQVNAGSGKYDKKFVAERTREYVEQMDNDLYRELGIEPREVRILEQRVKAIRKNLSIMDRDKEGIAAIKAMSPEQLEREGKTQGLSQGINQISRVLEQENLEGQFILPFDEQGVEKRKQLLKRKYELLYEVVEMWKENNSK